MQAVHRRCFEVESPDTLVFQSIYQALFRNFNSRHRFRPNLRHDWYTWRHTVHDLLAGSIQQHSKGYYCSKLACRLFHSQRCSKAAQYSSDAISTGVATVRSIVRIGAANSILMSFVFSLQTCLTLGLPGIDARQYDSFAV
jgi:hypothetical protein